MTWRNSVLEGDVLARLADIPDESVHCVVTSPPYWGLRDYGVQGQYGLEARLDCQGWATGTPCGECYICRMTAVFTEARRVLRPDGTLWLNMGDSYSVGTNCPGSFRRDRIQCCPRGRVKSTGLPPKNLLGQPWRLAFALQALGWVLRSDIIWHKPAPMPEAVQDRPTKSHEYLFLLTLQGDYYYDHESSREPASGTAHPRGNGINRKIKVPSGWDTGTGAHGSFHRGERANPSFSAAVNGLVGTRNPRSVWTIPSARFPGAHFATFPPALVERCIRAGCPPHGIVLDPFLGSGTTALVALSMGRDYVGIELNPEYVDMARARIARRQEDLGLLEYCRAGAPDPLPGNLLEVTA